MTPAFPADRRQELIAQHDQDLASARDWYATLTEAQRIEIWLAIQAIPDNGLDGAGGIVARLAQLGFEDLALERAR